MSNNPRAIKLTPETIKVISANKSIMTGDLPPNLDDLIDVVTIPTHGNSGQSLDYYLVTDHPGVTSDKPISWVLIPDFMFHERFRFAAQESNRQLISILEKER